MMGAGSPYSRGNINSKQGGEAEVGGDCSAEGLL